MICKRCQRLIEEGITVIEKNRYFYFCDYGCLFDWTRNPHEGFLERFENG